MTGINLSAIRDPEARRLLAELNDTLRDMSDKIEAALKATEAPKADYNPEPLPIRSGGPWDGRASIPDFRE